MKSALVKREGFTEEQVELIKNQIAKGTSDGELQLFMMQCQKTGLDPFARQIFCIGRPAYDKETKTYKQTFTTQVSIDGLRLIAERSGKYTGQVGPFWCGEDGIWKEVWLDKGQPKAAKVGVLRNDFKEPVFAVARFDAYKQTNKENVLNNMWQKMGDVMLAKCAESLALRKAFPQELSGLYTTDEMGQSDSSEEVVDVSYTKQDTLEDIKQLPSMITADQIKTKPKKSDVGEKLTNAIKAAQALGMDEYDIKSYAGVETFVGLTLDQTLKAVESLMEEVTARQSWGDGYIEQEEHDNQMAQAISNF